VTPQPTNRAASPWSLAGAGTLAGAPAPLSAATSSPLVDIPRPGQPPQPRAVYQPFALRPLQPGTQLRGNRYRLLELLERQDWLSSAYEAIWLGQDAHRGGGQVMICEVALPEPNSIMTQTLLRTATMSLVSVGRHRHIPALWDAFSDQGRGFFVFEPIEGESLAARVRYGGRPMPEQEVIECCLQMTEVLELLAQQSPPFAHGLIRPEHILIGRNGSQYYLTTFSVVLAGGGTQYITGIDRARLSPYTAPEFVRGVADTRTDIYSLLATAYFAITGSTPSAASGNIPQAQRLNGFISSEFDAILSRGLRSVATQRYQRPSELRQDLLALRSVSGTLIPNSQRDTRTSTGLRYEREVPFPATANRQQESARHEQAVKEEAPPLLQDFPIDLDIDQSAEDRAILLPKPEELPPMPARNDQMNAVMLLGLILVALIILVVLSQTLA
jgi:serine/threonine protein kinase